VWVNHRILSYLCNWDLVWGSLDIRTFVVATLRGIRSYLCHWCRFLLLYSNQRRIKILSLILFLILWYSGMLIIALFIGRDWRNGLLYLNAHSITLMLTTSSLFYFYHLLLWSVALDIITLWCLASCHWDLSLLPRLLIELIALISFWH